MTQEAYSISASDLAALGKSNIPSDLLSSQHLIYSSPATLAFNSPGAQGFGVKRAALAVPGSVELLVAPGCCGRNTSALNAPAYRDRFFYLLLDETDIVTGRHLKKIPDAVCEILESLEERPSCVMICITCVDALLGTDMERVCRKAQAAAGVPVLPTYMYALTREGRQPPMVSVRKTVYALLKKRKKNPRTVNILGEFSPFYGDTELFDLLRGIGITTINEISRCGEFEDYLAMAEANFNLILNPECRLAADDLKKRLDIPGIELTRQYQLDKIHRQYELLGAALGITFDDSSWYRKAAEAVDAFAAEHPHTTFAIGEWMNGDPFELSLALLRYGHVVSEIFGTVSQENFVYVRRIAQLSPDTRIYSNLSPSMMNYDRAACPPDLTIGQDAAYYHPDCPNVPWNGEEQPFGYSGLGHLMEACKKALA